MRRNVPAVAAEVKVGAQTVVVVAAHLAADTRALWRVRGGASGAGGAAASNRGRCDVASGAACDPAR